MDSGEFVKSTEWLNQQDPTDKIEEEDRRAQACLLAGAAYEVKWVSATLPQGEYARKLQNVICQNVRNIEKPAGEKKIDHQCGVIAMLLDHLSDPIGQVLAAEEKGEIDVHDFAMALCAAADAFLVRREALKAEEARIVNNLTMNW